MKTILISILSVISTVTVLSQEKKVSALNDSTELQQYDDGQSLKVRYLLNSSAISLKDKDKLLANETYVRQEFNIRTVGKEPVGEINLLIEGAVPEKKTENKPMIISPHSVNIFSNLKGTPFPDFNWTDIRRNSYSLLSLKGKVVVLNFWHTSCVPCIAEMPLLNELVKQYAGKEVLFIASTLNDEAQTKKFLQTTKFEYRQVAGIDPQTIFDPFPGWPVHIVLDKEGLIRFHALGKQNDIEQKLIKSIDEALAK
jgi:thiol-disulfide isomerase/thioredoxin